MKVEYVYFIGFINSHSDDVYIKIGKAKDIKRRISNLQCGNPFELMEFARVVVKTKDKSFDAHTLEDWFREAYKSCHVRGEWYCLNRDKWSEYMKSENVIIGEDYWQSQISFELHENMDLL